MFYKHCLCFYSSSNSCNSSVRGSPSSQYLPWVNYSYLFPKTATEADLKLNIDSASLMSNKLIFSSWHCVDRVKHIDRLPYYLMQVDFQENHYAKHSLEGLHLHIAATVTCFRDDIIECHVALYTFQPQKEIIWESHRNLISVLIIFSRQKLGLEWDIPIYTACAVPCRILSFISFYYCYYFIEK